MEALCAAGFGVLEQPAALVLVPDATLAYGEVDLAGRAMQQMPGDCDWRTVPGGIPCVLPARYRLHEATVHGPEGVVTVGRYVVAETLDQVWPEQARAWRDGAVWMQREQFTAARFDQAEHLLTGNCRNYYHWMRKAS